MEGTCQQVASGKHGYGLIAWHLWYPTFELHVKILAGPVHCRAKQPLHAA